MTNVHMSNESSKGDEYSQVLIDQISVMVHKEESFYSCTDYLGEVAVSPELIEKGWYVSTHSQM